MQISYLVHHSKLEIITPTYNFGPRSLPFCLTYLLCLTKLFCSGPRGGMYLLIFSNYPIMCYSHLRSVHVHVTLCNAGFPNTFLSLCQFRIRLSYLTHSFKLAVFPNLHRIPPWLHATEQRNSLFIFLWPY